MDVSPEIHSLSSHKIGFTDSYFAMIEEWQHRDNQILLYDSKPKAVVGQELLMGESTMKGFVPIKFY